MVYFVFGNIRTVIKQINANAGAACFHQAHQNKKAAATNLSQRPMEGIFIKMCTSSNLYTISITQSFAFFDHSIMFKALMCAFDRNEVPGSNQGIRSSSSPLRVFRRGDFLCVFKDFQGFVLPSPYG